MYLCKVTFNIPIPATMLFVAVAVCGDTSVAGSIRGVFDKFVDNLNKPKTSQ